MLCPRILLKVLGEFSIFECKTEQLNEYPGLTLPFINCSQGETIIPENEPRTSNPMINKICQFNIPICSTQCFKQFYTQNQQSVMKGSITSIPTPFHNPLNSSQISDQVGDPSSDSFDSLSRPTILNKISSQTGFVGTPNRVGAKINVLNANLHDAKNTDLFEKKSITPGKENAGNTKLTDILQKPNPILQTPPPTPTLLPSLGVESTKRQTSSVAYSTSAAKSKAKDPRIQELIESNVPKMTRPKEYYIQKLIECENVLRTKDKKLKALEKNEREFKDTLDKASASELMYKTQLQALQRYQSGKVNDTSGLESKISELEQTNQTQLQSVIEFKTLYSQAKVLNAQLETSNAQLSMKLSAASQESSAKASQIKDMGVKCSALQTRIIGLQKQNKQLIYTIEQLKVLREKEVEISAFYQKRLEMEICTLSESLNSRFEQEESTANLKDTHLVLENSQLKKFIEINQAQQVKLQGILKLRNIQLQTEVRQALATIQSQKQASSQTIDGLKNELVQSKTKCAEWETLLTTSTSEWKQIQEGLAGTVNSLQQKIERKTEEIEKYKSLVEFATNQAKELGSVADKYQQQQDTIQELTQNNKSLTSRLCVLESAGNTLKELLQQLSEFEQLPEPSSVNYGEIFAAINTTLNTNYTWWNVLTQQPEITESPYQGPCQGVLTSLSIEETEGWETALVQTVQRLLGVDQELKDLSLKFKEKTKYYETRLHVCKQEDERKTLFISDLKANIKLTEKSLNEASDKLIKCTTLLEQSNQKVLVAEARLADAKNELAAMYSELKAENQKIFQRNHSVEIQLRDLLAKHYEGFYDEIVQRTPEDLLRLDVFLIKSFLATTIEINHHIKQTIPTSAYMQQLLVERDTVLGEIRQYYKQILEPEIAQVMAYYKPVNQKAVKFQGN